VARKKKRFNDQPFRYHEEIELDIHTLTNLGAGLGRVALPGDAGATPTWVVMVPYALPGERIRARVFRNHKNYSEADLLEILTPSPCRIAPRCPLFGRCGGCQYQNLEYAGQLAWKRRHVEELLRHMAGIEFPVSPVIGSPRQYAYRSKITPHFNAPKPATPKPTALNLAAPNPATPDPATPNPAAHQAGLAACATETAAPNPTTPDHDTPNPAARQAGLAACATGTTAPNPAAPTPTAFEPDTPNPAALEPTAPNPTAPNPAATAEFPIGFLRQGTRFDLLDVPRCDIATDAINARLPEVRAAVRARAAAGGFARGATLLLRDAGGEVTTDHDRVITERVGDITLHFLARDFFQNNPGILPAFTGYIRAQAAATGARHLVDAYCGSGLLALTTARAFERVSGIEISETSIRFARENAAANNITNATFRAGDASAIFAGLDFPPRDTVVVIDPPRKGCDEKFLTQLLAFAPRAVVYVSCDPATQMRDLARFTAHGWKLTAVQPFDLFPQTRHLECVITLHSPAPP
jgi:23S rRNA (uracil1939-C5)-methyltransferase/tRNA (uracil-5-)-methyltransferase